MKLLVILCIAFILPCQILSCPECPLPPPPKPKCPPSPIPIPQPKCPRDTLKLGVCTSWLGLVSGVIGTKPTPECCTLLQGVSDLEAALCLCTAIKANVLGIVHLEMPVAISLVLNGCGKNIPKGFKC